MLSHLAFLESHLAIPCGIEQKSRACRTFGACESTFHQTIRRIIKPPRVHFRHFRVDRQCISQTRPTPPFCALEGRRGPGGARCLAGEHARVCGRAGAPGQSRRARHAAIERRGRLEIAISLICLAPPPASPGTCRRTSRPARRGRTFCRWPRRWRTGDTRWAVRCRPTRPRFPSCRPSGSAW